MIAALLLGLSAAAAACPVERAKRELDSYVCSPVAQRGFYSVCGTPLTYEGAWLGLSRLTGGSFDRAGRLRPSSLAGVESWHEAWLDSKDLATTRTDELAHIARKWMEACGKLPD